MAWSKPVIISTHLIPNLLIFCLVALELEPKLVKNINSVYREQYIDS